MQELQACEWRKEEGGHLKQATGDACVQVATNAAFVQLSLSLLGQHEGQAEGVGKAMQLGNR